MSSAIYVSINKILEDNYEENSEQSMCKKKTQLRPWASAMRVFFKADFFPATGEEGTLLSSGMVEGLQHVVQQKSSVMCVNATYSICTIDSDET